MLVIGKFILYCCFWLPFPFNTFDCFMVFKPLIVFTFSVICTSAQITYFPSSLLQSVCLWQWQAVLVCLYRQHERVLTCQKINLRFAGGREPQCMWLWCTAQCFGCVLFDSVSNSAASGPPTGKHIFLSWLADKDLKSLITYLTLSSYSVAFFCFYTLN